MPFSHTLLFHVSEYPLRIYPIHLPLAVFSLSSYTLFSSAYNNADRHSWWEAIGTTHSVKTTMTTLKNQKTLPGQRLACQGARTTDYRPTGCFTESLPFYISLHHVLLLILHIDSVLSVYSTRHSSGPWLRCPSQTTPHYTKNKKQWDSFKPAIQYAVFFSFKFKPH